MCRRWRDRLSLKCRSMVGRVGLNITSWWRRLGSIGWWMRLLVLTRAGDWGRVQKLSRRPGGILSLPGRWLMGRVRLTTVTWWRTLRWSLTR